MPSPPSLTPPHVLVVYIASVKWHKSLTCCQVRVYSGRGSGQVRTKADEGEGQRAGKGISPAGVETDWIQRQGGRALIPCVGSGQGDGVGDGGRDRQRLE